MQARPTASPYECSLEHELNVGVGVLRSTPLLYQVSDSRMTYPPEPVEVYEVTGNTQALLTRTVSRRYRGLGTNKCHG